MVCCWCFLPANHLCPGPETGWNTGRHTGKSLLNSWIIKIKSVGVIYLKSYSSMLTLLAVYLMLYALSSSSLVMGAREESFCPFCCLLPHPSCTLLHLPSLTKPPLGIWWIQGSATPRCIRPFQRAVTELFAYKWTTNSLALNCTRSKDFYTKGEKEKCLLQDSTFDKSFVFNM